MPLDEFSNSALTDRAIPADWPPLDGSLLGEARPAAAAFPLHLLPGRWRAWVEAAAPAFGSPDYLAHCLLGGVAAVGSAGILVGVTPSWREPLLLWQALIGGPSSGKSAVFARVRALLAAVKPWQEEEGEEGEASGEGGAAISVLVNAKLDQLRIELYSSVRGVLLWRDELGDWMRSAERPKARPAWLAAWSAGPARIGYAEQERLAVGIAGALTPDRVAGFVDGDSSLAARFLYCWPERGNVPSLAAAEPDDEGMLALMQKIANFAGHRETPGLVPLDAAATRRLEELIGELRARADAADGTEAEWIAKGVPTIVRLAGVLTMMEWAEQSEAEWLPVGAARVEAAHELWSSYYLPHAQSVFDRAGIAGCERAARRVARWLKRLHLDEISREDVRREALSQSVSAERAEDVLARLEAGGVVRLMPLTGSEKGGPRRRRWAVHPQLASARQLRAS